MRYLHLFCVIFHVSKWDKAYIIDLNAWRFLMNFLCIYLGEGRGGGALMHVHVYLLEHIISLSYRTTWWMFTKLDRDEVLIITHLFIDFLANSTQGRFQGGGGQFSKNSSMRYPSPKDFFFRSECNSNKPNASPYPELKYCDCCCSDWFHKYGSHAFWFAKKSNF